MGSEHCVHRCAASVITAAIAAVLLPRIRRSVFQPVGSAAGDPTAPVLVSQPKGRSHTVPF